MRHGGSQPWAPAASPHPALVLGGFTGEHLSVAWAAPEPGVGAARERARSSCALLAADSTPGRRWLGNVLRIGGSTGAGLSPPGGSSCLVPLPTRNPRPCLEGRSEPVCRQRPAHAASDQHRASRRQRLSGNLGTVGASGVVCKAPFAWARVSRHPQRQPRPIRGSAFSGFS